MTTKVLLVEDEPLIRTLMVEVLEDEGFDVTTTCTGDEAAILLAEDGFSVLLTDVNMPGTIDGIGLAHHAREVHPGLPIVIISGRPDSETRARTLAAPIAFFRKPCDLNAVAGAVGNLALAN